MKYKYIVSFPVPQPYRRRIEKLMAIAAACSGIPSPATKLRPHITFHRPIENIDEETIKRVVQSIVLQIRQTRITVSGFHAFGKEYIVLPVHGTVEVAYLWTGILKLLSAVPEYVHGTFDHDNTLHITIAEKITPVFDTVWPLLQAQPFESMTIPVKKIAIDRKLIGVDGSSWERVKEYSIPKRKK